MDLREKLDLPDAATPALEVIAGAERLPAGIMIADASADVEDGINRSEVE